MRTWILACFAACLAVVATSTTASAATVDLGVTMTDAPDPVTAGQNVQFVITVTDAVATANNVKVTDILPSGTGFVAANGTNWTCTTTPINTPPVTITCLHTTMTNNGVAAPFLVGTQPPITIIVTSPVAGGVLTNTATVSTSDTDTTNTANNSATTTTQVNTSADLSITETAAPSPIAAASTLTYTLKVNNAGPSPAGLAHVVDTLDAAVTFVSATGAGWTCTNTGTTVTCDADPLALGAAPDIVVVVTAPTQPQTVTNAVAISAATTDAVPANNSATIDTVVVAGADLSLALTQDNASILVSGALAFTIIVTNHGPSTAQNLTVTNTLPAGDTYLGATGTGWTCTNAASDVTCTLPSLPVGDAAPIAIMVTGPGTPQKVIDMALVGSTTADPLMSNNTATIETTVLGSADVGVALTGTARALTSSQLVFTISVTNQGPSTAQSIRAIDTLPEGTTFVSAAGLHWGCKALASTVTCDTTSLDASGVAPDITITVTAPPDGDSVLDTVTVSSATHDPSMDNNAAMAISNLDQIGVRGGGCQVGGGGAGLVILIGAAFALRRRRTAVVAGLVAIGTVGAFGTAHAQIAGSSESFPIDHTHLALDGDGLLGVEWAGVPRPGDWSVATFLGYQTNPLVLYNERTGATIDPLVKKRISGDVAIGVGITSWFEAGLEMPIIYNQSRDTTIPMTTLKSPRAGDLRLSPKFLILKGGDGKVSLGAIAGIRLPTGGKDGYAGDGGVTVSPELLVSFRKGGFRAGVDGGLIIRSSKEVVPTLTIDNELFARIGVGYRTPFGLELAAMLMSSTSTSNVYSHINTDPLEADLGVTYNTEGFGLFVQGGRGIHTGIGTPELRFLAGIRISPAGDARPLDTDGDGIPDAKDKCPREAEDKDGFQDEDGCPEADNDKDGISDEDDRCPNEPEDKDGFQDTDGCPDPDNDNDGLLDAKDQCPNEAEDKDGFQDDDGCPDLDNDKDGIPDTEDRCPGEPGPKETHGCPDKDSDGDGVVDRLDTCPDDKGTDANGGCMKRQAALIRADRIELADKVTLRGAAVDAKSAVVLDAVAKIFGNHGQIKVRVDGKNADVVVRYLSSKGISPDRVLANPSDTSLAFILVDKFETAKPEETKPIDEKKPDEKKPDEKKPDEKKPDEPDIEMEP